jgi:hypothetical protein
MADLAVLAHQPGTGCSTRTRVAQNHSGRCPGVDREPPVAPVAVGFGVIWFEVDAAYKPLIHHNLLRRYAVHEATNPSPN